jgi:hypothetical protein
VSRICAAWLAALLLCACGAPKIKPATGSGAAGPLPAPAAIPAYRIDPAQSELRLLVYRTGALARLGHNHVIVNHALAGWVDAKKPLSSASFSLRVPVADFVVDDAQARAGEGADFSTAVPDDAKAGTRHNMLGAALLDAERYPTITLTSAGIRQQPGKLLATMTVELKGRESTIVVPFTLEMSADRIAASGTVVLRQSELGLTPFSVMLGALQVQDEFTVRFRLVALPSGS